MFWFQAMLAVVCGAVLSTALPPVGLWFLFLALVPLFALVAASERPRDAFGLGFWFGLGFFALYIFWLPNSLSSIFGPVAWAMYPPIVLICAAFWGLVTWASRLIGRRGTGTLWLLPAFWLLMEWGRTQGPLAFPWGSLGYLWLGTPLAQAADIAGSYGLSFLTLVIVALIAAPLVPAPQTGDKLFDRSSQARGFLPWLGIPIAIALGVATFFYGSYKLKQIPPAPDRQALLVQGNTDPLGRAQGISNDFEVYTRLSSAGTAQFPEVSLVVWPEGALLQADVGPIEGMNGEEARKRLQDSVNGKTIISGAAVWEGYTGYNRVYGFSGAQVTDKYDKIYLVPFGEGLIFFNALKPVYDIVLGWFGFGAYNRLPGKTFDPITTPEVNAAVYVCYESVFPQVARNMVKRGGQVLVNISNDAWFGSGDGAEQHFLMGTMRAIETRRYLLRAGNDGITAVINPLGQVLERLERRIEGTLVGDYAIVDGLTFYVRFGDGLIWVVAAYAVVVGVMLGFRRD